MIRIDAKVSPHAANMLFDATTLQEHEFAVPLNLKSLPVEVSESDYLWLVPQIIVADISVFTLEQN